MRVCPKCGYVDDARWRQDRWRWEKDWCTLEDFRVMYPKLAKELENGRRVVVDSCFAYRLRGKARHLVERVWVKLYEWGGNSAFGMGVAMSGEKVHHMFDPFQKKLFETGGSGREPT